MNNKIYKTTWL